MIAAEHSAPRPPTRRWHALLVLGLLAGLLGMHALAPGGAVERAEHVRSAHAVATLTAVDDCPDEGHCGGHHLRHADATCASAAVSGGPQLPALVPDPVAAPVRAERARSHPATAPDGARAPPSLAELQLLRI
ncbi:DUF6153 family protein [Streptomyces olivochromogenes]|uniref:DUF6153 family protein n=1 Tax=Streptomyces olivochromogenes TaxID=1963 RepID=UPI001F3E1B0E|nr:DUF6153 family protein [Streptomyces olivochromogenes]MCF3130895.1 hypothetical protein [Streptomyces olivochromogenes]